MDGLLFIPLHSNSLTVRHQGYVLGISFAICNKNPCTYWIFVVVFKSVLAGKKVGNSYPLNHSPPLFLVLTAPCLRALIREPACSLLTGEGYSLLDTREKLVLTTTKLISKVNGKETTDQITNSASTIPRNLRHSCLIVTTTIFWPEQTATLWKYGEPLATHN